MEGTHLGSTNNSAVVLLGLFLCLKQAVLLLQVQFHISLTQGWAPSRELLFEVQANPSGSQFPFGICVSLWIL